MCLEKEDTWSEFVDNISGKLAEITDVNPLEGDKLIDTEEQ